MFQCSTFDTVHSRYIALEVLFSRLFFLVSGSLCALLCLIVPYCALLCLSMPYYALLCLIMPYYALLCLIMLFSRIFGSSILSARSCFFNRLIRFRKCIPGTLARTHVRTHLRPHVRPRRAVLLNVYLNNCCSYYRSS